MIIIQLDSEQLSGLIQNAVRKAVSEIPQSNTTQPETDRWFNIEELRQYHPDKPVRATVYGWVHTGLIPFHKKSKKLFFLKSEIDLWLKEGRRKTTAEISAEADNYLSNQKNRR